MLGLSSVIARPEGHLAELLLFSHARSPAAHLPLLAACAKQAYAPVREWRKKRKAADALKALEALGFTKRPRFYCSASVGAADTATEASRQ